MSNIKFKLGLRRSSNDPRDYDYKLKVPMNVKLPIEHEIIPRAIYNQGNIGSCSSMAIGNQIMALKNYDDNNYPSRLFQYYNSRLIEGNVEDDSGCTYRAAYKCLAKFGFLEPEELWEYDTTKFKDKPPEELYNKTNKTLIKKYQSLIPSIYAIEYAISQNKIVTFGTIIYDNFNDYDKTDFIIKYPQGGQLGGHAMALVGYDHNKKLFKIVNSWGPEWGNNGCAFMYYDHVIDEKYSFDFWTISKDE